MLKKRSLDLCFTTGVTYCLLEREQWRKVLLGSQRFYCTENYEAAMLLNPFFTRWISVICCRRCEKADFLALCGKSAPCAGTGISTKERQFSSRNFLHAHLIPYSRNIRWAGYLVRVQTGEYCVCCILQVSFLEKVSYTNVTTRQCL